MRYSLYSSRRPSFRTRLLKRVFLLLPLLLIALSLPFTFPGERAKAAVDNLFPPTATPAVPTATDSGAVELGVKFTSDVGGTIAGIRFYKGDATNGGTHYGHLWTSDGTQLAQAQFTNETASGWQSVDFTAPISITANTTYIASYYAPQGHYSYTSSGLSAAQDNPPLHTVANSVSPNGVYLYTTNPTGGLPSSTFNATNYWVDVNFTPGSIDTTPPTVSITSPTNNQTLSGTVQVTANASDNVAVASVHYYLDGQSLGNPVTSSPYTLSWDTTKVANGTHTLTAVATDTSNNTGTSTGVPITVQNSITPPPAGPVSSIWSSTTTPTNIDSNDASSVTLGVKFQSSLGGYITGIRFYKGNTNNGGTHIGELWSSSGTLLAKAIFTNETASGWQDVVFGSAVPISANTTYVASYFAPLGHYSYDSGSNPGALATSVSHPPLQALASGTSGGNGVYVYSGSAAFPNQTFNNSNYWVDVDFSATGQLAAATQPTPRAGVRGSGPVLVLTDPTNPYTDDYCNALFKTEGIPECAATDTANLTTSFSLTGYRSIVLADGAPLTSGQISQISSWISGGGMFIAMRPNDNLDSLLGIGQLNNTLPDAYYQFNSASFPGLETQTMQYHGVADEHQLAGAQATATLFSNASTTTTYPAITSLSIGSGKAIAYMFDASRSVLLTRNGNPDLPGQVTVSTDGLPRIVDRFGSGWLDTSKVAIPQADELERSVANLIESSTLPRLWYFPSYQNNFIKAALILTGDDHATNSQTLSRFAAESAASPANCSVANWTCYTSTSYAFSNAFSDSAAKPYTDNGFEVSLHMSDNGSCASNWTTQAQFDSLFSTALQAWRTSYPTISSAYPPVTERIHCYGINNDYSSVPAVESKYGIKADTNAPCWPNNFLNVAQCMFTGTGMPEQYTDTYGNTTGVYQFTTQATDENAPTVAQPAISGLVANATGPNAYYGYFTVLCHLDNLAISNQCATDTLGVAQTKSIPMVSTKQAEQFWDGRNTTAISGVTYGTSTLSFTVNTPVSNMQLMIPSRYGAKSLTTVTINGTASSFTTQTINGISYGIVMLPSGSNSFVASYN